MQECFNHVEVVNKSKGYYILKSLKGWFQNRILI
jgi:16S rRNA G1207 methylase RsmC